MQIFLHQDAIIQFIKTALPVRLDKLPGFIKMGSHKSLGKYV